MKGILSNSKFSVGSINGATGAAGSDLLVGEIDTGGAQNGTLILVVNNAASSDVANVEVWTSTRSDFATSTTQISAIVSDGCAQLAIASDLDSLYAKGVLEAAVSDLTVSSNRISNLTEDGMYVINLKNCRRYINCQYDSDGAGGTIACVFIGHNLETAPWPGARTAYS